MFFRLQNYVLKLIVKVCKDTLVHQQHKLFYNHLTLALEKLQSKTSPTFQLLSKNYSNKLIK